MLKLRRSDYDEIRRHGEETYPHECCGILLGIPEPEGRVVRRTVRCVNTRLDSPARRYAIDARDLIRVQHEAREQDVDIVGFYHSHADHPARWSETDFEEAHWIGCSYVIISVDHGHAAHVNSFLLSGTLEENKAFVEEDLSVEDGG